MTAVFSYMIEQINKKIEEHGITLGDSLMLLTFELARIELLNDNTFSDNTLKALNEIGCRTSRFYYRYDYPELFQIIQDGLDSRQLQRHNPNVYNADITIVGIEKQEWAAFFAKGIKILFDKLKKSAI